MSLSSFADGKNRPASADSSLAAASTPFAAKAKKTVHFIGIGGIGMSAIARMYLAQGIPVQGTDAKKSDIVAALELEGARVRIGHDPAHLDGADIVVYSSSIPENHPERRAAREKGLLVLHRAEALAGLCDGKFTIAVAGTHGKTTTTAMIGSALKEAGREPSIVVGGLVAALGGNAHCGAGPEIVIEADESDSSFLRFSPDIAVITNIEEDHMDHYENIAAIERAFRNFIERIKPGGQWIGCGDDERIVKLAASTPVKSILYGFKKAPDRFWADNLLECPAGQRGVAFDTWYGGEKLGRVRLKLIGRHNVLNALAAIAVGRSLGMAFEHIIEGLESFAGTGRRFDVTYDSPKVLVADDYAHHPTEIRTTLAAAKGIGRKRLVAVFQPHRYSRTEALLHEFAASFAAADRVILTDIYAAGELPRDGVNGEMLRMAVSATGHRSAEYVGRQGLTDHLLKEMAEGDLFLIMGAGDITQVAAEMAVRLKGQTTEHPFKGLRGKVVENEPLARHTTLKTGGPAAYWIEPADLEDLKECLAICRREKKRIAIFGMGSNMMPVDSGFDGVAIHLGSPFFKQTRIEKGRVVAGGGVPNTLFIQFALENNLGGCEFLTGIPGNIGGAVAMNAGSHNQSIDALLHSATIVTFGGEVKTLLKEEIGFAYRSSGIWQSVVVEASFNLKPVPRETSQKILDEYREYRQRTQDLQHPSAGCMFKNPKIAGCSSGLLIDRAGLKGFRVGNAQVSEKHANFIINLGGARTDDLVHLIAEVKKKVRAEFGIELETEVKIIQ